MCAEHALHDLPAALAFQDALAQLGTLWLGRQRLHHGPLFALERRFAGQVLALVRVVRKVVKLSWVASCIDEL